MNNNRYDTTKYARAVITIERTAYTESGHMWTQTKSFPLDASLREVLKYARRQQCSGRLTLTLDEGSEIEKEPQEMYARNGIEK